MHFSPMSMFVLEEFPLNPVLFAVLAATVSVPCPGWENEDDDDDSQ